jgi:PrgI family protein
LPLSRVYEIPTHLQVEDALIAGLTPRQLLRLVTGASIAYAVWDQQTFLPTALRAGVTATVVVLGVVFAVVHPGGRSLDQWVLAAIVFIVSPKHWRWEPGASAPETDSAELDEEWADLVPPVDWAESRRFDLHLGRDFSVGPAGVTRARR